MDAIGRRQVERKFGWQQEKCFWAKEKELEELDKDVIPLLLFSPTSLLDSFSCFSNLYLLRPPVYLGPNSSCFTKDQLYTSFYLQ